MAKNLLVGVGSKARKVKALYVGVGGKARKVKKVYVGVGGKARLVHTSYVPVTGIDLVLPDDITQPTVTITAVFTPSGSLMISLCIWTWFAQRIRAVSLKQKIALLTHF